ncbi:MAG: hypothetical protein QOE36_1885 [Gaiellaceae bacterium]|nr:hypothetical protein [Gaiellaceae bacterium]
MSPGAPPRTNTSINGSDPFKKRWAYAAGIAIGMASGWNIANVGAVAEPLAHDYDISLATIGLFTTALFVVHLASQVPAGRAADRFGARRVALAALVVLVVANAFASISPNPALALAARALCGVGTGFGFVAGSDYVRASGGSPLVQGLFGGASVAAPGVALAVIPQLHGPLGFRAPFLTAIVISFAVLGLLALAPEAPAATRRAVGERSPSVARDKRLYRFGVLHAATFGLSVVIGNWIVTLLVKHGHGHAAAGAVGSLTLLLGMITRPLGGWLLRRRPEQARAMLAASLVAGAAGTAVLALPAPFPLLVLASAVVGLAAGMPFAAAFGGAAATRPDAPGAAVGFVNAWSALAILAGTPLLGLSFSLPGEGRTGFAVVAVLWAAALAALPHRLPA